MLTGGATTWDFAEEVTRRYGVDRRVYACPDPTGGARKTSGVGVTDHTILRRSGFTVQSPRAHLENPRQNNRSKHSLDGCKRRPPHIHSSTLQRTYKIPPHPHVLPPERAYPTKTLGVDHAFDAFGYLVLQQFNLAKPETMGSNVLSVVLRVSSLTCFHVLPTIAFQATFWDIVPYKPTLQKNFCTSAACSLIAITSASVSFALGLSSPLKSYTRQWCL